MRSFDRMANITWPIAHYRTAEHYLEQGPKTAAATGGSPWKKYLHPYYQKRIFFPGLWTEEEEENWAKEEL